MAYSFVTNFEPLTDGHAIWRFKEGAVAAGASVVRSGDGTTFSSSGDVHAPGGPYVASLDQSNAWFELRASSGMTPRRSWLFQRPNTTKGAWRMWYSSDGTGFTGGSPSATVRGTAADEQGVINTPSGSTDVWGSSAVIRALRTHYVFGGSGEQWGWLMLGTPIGKPYPLFMWYFDPLTGVSTGDVDGAIMGFMGPTSSLTSNTLDENYALFGTTDSQTNACAHGWFKKGLSGATWVNYPPGLMGAQISSSNNWSTIGNNNPPGTDANGRIPTFPVTYYRPGTAFSTQKGWKGASTLFKYEMGIANGPRPYADKSRFILGALSIPWDGVSEMIT